MTQDRGRRDLLELRPELQPLEVDLLNDLAAGALTDRALEADRQVVDDSRLGVVVDQGLRLAAGGGDDGLPLREAVGLGERGEVLVRGRTVVGVTGEELLGA